MISQNFLYSIHKDKKSIYLLCEDKAVIDCQSIYEELFRLEKTADFTFEEFQSYTPSLFFYSTLLTGSQELPNHPFFFGELDKEGNIKQEQPSYYFAPKDETLDKGKLTIYLHNLTLTLLNYSLSNESLKIKLKSKQSTRNKSQTKQSFFICCA